MYRALIMATLFLSASVSFAGKPAPAQPPPPPATNYVPAIAYSSHSGKTSTLFLANQDGSNAISVYSSSKNITEIDLAPGGGKIAFSESGALKVLSYTASPSAVVVTGIVQLDVNAASPDFSLDGSKIVYQGASLTGSEVRIISSSGGVPHSVLPGAVFSTIYLHSNNRIAYFKRNPVGGAYELYVVDLDANDNVVSSSIVLSTSSQVFKAMEDIDSARTKDSILITANYPTSIRLIELDLSTNTLIDRVAGFRGHFSSDDSKIIYTDSSTDQIYKYSILSNSSVQLTNTNPRSVDYGFTDYMP
jgi:hypothetical protein